jgi:hypothetical protein
MAISKNVEAKPANLIALDFLGARYNGYFFDRQYNLYSNKSGTHVKLLGTFTGGIRRYTLSGLVITAANLKSCVIDSAAWKKFWRDFDNKATSANPDIVKTVPERGDSIIASIVDGRLVVGTNPKVHVTAKSLTDEMTRLANVSPGTLFIALTVSKTCIAGEIKWS